MDQKPSCSTTSAKEDDFFAKYLTNQKVGNLDYIIFLHIMVIVFRYTIHDLAISSATGRLSIPKIFLGSMSNSGQLHHLKTEIEGVN